MGSAAGAISGGSKGGGGASGGGIGSITDAIAQASALSAQFSQKAIASLEDYYKQAQQQYSNYYSAANQNLQTANPQTQNILQGGFAQANQTLLGGQQLAGTYLSPYINAGLPALDAYSQSMGLGTPVGGSLAAFNQQQAAAQQQANANQAIGDQYNKALGTYNQQQNEFQNKLAQFTGGANGLTPGANAGYVYDPATGKMNKAAVGAQGMDKLDETLKAAQAQYNAMHVAGANVSGYGGIEPALGPDVSADYKINRLNILKRDFSKLDAAAGSPVFGQIDAAISGYKAPVAASSQDFGMAPVAPDQAKYLPAQTPIAPAPEMTSNATGAQQGLQNFYASPEYQALYGGSPSEMTTQSVEQRFQNDPGYQFQLQQGLQAVQNKSIANGQGYSPAMAQALAGYTTGLASQHFDTYRSGLANTFTQYQNQLQNLSGMGATASGAGAALAQQTSQGINQNQTGLAAGQANVNQATAQGLSANAMNAATGQSALTQNTGSSIANAYTGQGDNQSSLALAAGQARAGQSQYQNSSSASAMGGLGAGIGSLTSLFGSSQSGGSSGGSSGSGGGGGMMMGAGKGAASGAAAGSMFGPWGTAIGAVGGGLLGAFSSK